MAAVLTLELRVIPGLPREAPFAARGSSYKKKAGRPCSGRTAFSRVLPYFDEPLLPVLPLLLPLEPVLPLAPLLLPEPMPLLLGLVVLLEPEAPPLDELPPAPPVAPLELEPDLKWASHSERDTCPSLLVSTVVKLGAELDAPELLLSALPPLDELPVALGEELDELGVELDELPPLEAPDAPDAPLLLPVALGEDEDLSLLLEDELCAIDTLASANSAAAVAVVISFNFMWSFLHQGK
jgi:hypothetical protein